MYRIIPLEYVLVFSLMYSYVPSHRLILFKEKKNKKYLKYTSQNIFRVRKYSHTLVGKLHGFPNEPKVSTKNASQK